MQSRFLIYTIVIALSVAAIAGVLQLGERWHPSGEHCRRRDVRAAPAQDVATTPCGRPLALLIVQLLVIVLATQTGGRDRNTAAPAGRRRRDCRRTDARSIAPRAGLARRRGVSLP